MENSASRSAQEKEYYSLVKLFDALAPYYDIIASPLIGAREKVVDMACARRGARILDVATGTGKQAFAFAKRGYDVSGIDLSEGMLDVARRNNRHGNATFRLADATRLPFRSGSFDVCCISFALHDMPASIQRKVLREMKRVTSLHGKIIVADYSLPGNEIWRFFVYNFVRLYEGPYYPPFVKKGLESLLQENGVKIKEKTSVLFGAGKIARGAWKN